MRRRRPWPGPGQRVSLPPRPGLAGPSTAAGPVGTVSKNVGATAMTRLLNLGPVQEARRSIRGSTAAAGECRRTGAPSKPRTPAHSCLNSPDWATDSDRRTVTLVSPRTRFPWIAPFVVIVHGACSPGRARYPARDLIIDICRSPGTAQPSSWCWTTRITQRRGHVVPWSS
jgi:hypothetical protein